MSVNGKPYHADGLQDGHFVFHCHILGHEDVGMMKTIEVLGRGQKPTPPPMAGMKHHAHGM